MRNAFILFLAFALFSKSFAQTRTTQPNVLKAGQVAELFPDTVCKTLGLTFPIFRVYNYSDNTGQHYCILAESRDEITANKDTINHKIKAISITINKATISKQWEINDNIIINGNNESSIWFWTKYIDFKDYNGDGLIDPVIVYGTSAANGTDDGRIKFIVYYKGQKTAIRHQNGTLDFERETQVDKAFYDLPQSLQASIKQKMNLMMRNNDAIFPAGWEVAMKNANIRINERH